MNTTNHLRPLTIPMTEFGQIDRAKETPEMATLHKKLNVTGIAALSIFAATATAALTIAAAPVVLIGAGALTGVLVSGYALKTLYTLNGQKNERIRLITSLEGDQAQSITIAKLTELWKRHVITGAEYAGLLDRSDIFSAEDLNKIEDKDLKYNAWLKIFNKKLPFQTLEVLDAGIEAGYIDESFVRAQIKELMTISNWWQLEQCRPSKNEIVKNCLKEAWKDFLKSDSSLGVRSVAELMSFNEKFEFGCTEDEMAKIQGNFVNFALGKLKEYGWIPGLETMNPSVRDYQNQLTNVDLYKDLLRHVRDSDPEIVNFVQQQLINHLPEHGVTSVAAQREKWEADEEYLKANTNLNQEQRDVILLERFKIRAKKTIQEYLEADAPSFKYFRELFTNVQVPIKSDVVPYLNTTTVKFYIERNEYKVESKTFRIDEILILAGLDPSDETEWDKVVQKFLLGIEAEKYRDSKRSQNTNSYKSEDEEILLMFQPHYLSAHRHLIFKKIAFDWLIGPYKDDFFASLEKYGNGADYREKAIRYFSQKSLDNLSENENDALIRLLKLGVLTKDTVFTQGKNEGNSTPSEIIKNLIYFTVQNFVEQEPRRDYFFPYIIGEPQKNEEEEWEQGPQKLAALEFKFLFDSTPPERVADEHGRYVSCKLPDLTKTDKVEGDGFYVRAKAYASDSFREALNKARQEFAALSADPLWFQDEAKWKQALKIYDDLRDMGNPYL